MDAYCFLPWSKLKIDANGEFQSCCHQTEYYGNLITDNLSIEEALKLPILKEVRVETLNNTLHRSCNNKQCPYFFKDLKKDNNVKLQQYPEQIELNLPSTWCNIGGLNPTPETACIMCPRSSKKFMERDGGVDYTDELLVKIKPVIPHLKSFTVLGIAEPFWKGRIFDVLDKVDWRTHMEGKWFWTYSNATVLGEKYQDLFLNEYTDHTCLGFSIDATTPETYMKVRRLDYFKTIQRNLEMYFKKASIIKKEKDNSFISNNINMLNLHEVEDMVRFANNLGAHKLQLSLTYFSDDGMALKGDMLCNEKNWELFWETQQRAEQVAKELNQEIYFYYPFHNGYLKQ